MRNGWTKLTAKLTAILAALVVMIGCSSNSPLAPGGTSGSVNKGGNSDFTTAAQVEFGSHVATIDIATRKLTFNSNSEVVYAAADAEIVRRNSGNETPIDFSEIVVGDSVEVRGNRQSDNSVLADRLRVKTEDGNAEVEFGGRVATIDAGARTMTFFGIPTVISVMANAEVMNHDLQVQIDLSEIVPGDSVEIRGSAQADDSVLADRVRLRKNESSSSDLEFKSAITVIDYTAGTFTVNGRSETILVDAGTIVYAHLSDFEHGLSKRGHGGDDDDDAVGADTILSFTDLKVGDSVEVHANIVDTATLLAVRIELEGNHGMINEVEFKATIASIDAATRTVTFNGQTWNGTVVETAVLLGYNNEPISLSDFAVGQLVAVKGFPGATETLSIVRMHKENSL
ncbi:MAG: DUF5666 domain-containing protein [Candidatus Zixiibacteriota bacterium]